MTYKTFESERLLLRPSHEQDAPFIFSLMNTPKWKQYIGDRHVSDVEKAKQYIRDKMLPQLQRLGFSNYTVVRKTDGALMGSCGLYDREGLEGIDIGFAFLPEFEGQGYAFEAASCLLNAALCDFGLKEVVAITNRDNAPSRKLLEKLGLQLEGSVPGHHPTEDVLLYKIVAGV